MAKVGRPATGQKVSKQIKIDLDTYEKLKKRKGVTFNDKIVNLMKRK